MRGFLLDAMLYPILWTWVTICGLLTKHANHRTDYTGIEGIALSCRNCPEVLTLSWSSYHKRFPR